MSTREICCHRDARRDRESRNVNVRTINFFELNFLEVHWGWSLMLWRMWRILPGNLLCELLCEVCANRAGRAATHGTRWDECTDVKRGKSCRGLQQSAAAAGLARGIERVVFMLRTCVFCWPLGNEHTCCALSLTGVQRNLPRSLCSRVAEGLLGLIEQKAGSGSRKHCATLLSLNQAFGVHARRDVESNK